MSPHFETEQKIISSLLIDPDKLKELDLSVTELHDERHRAVYLAMLKMQENGDEINAETIYNHLSSNGKNPVEKEYFFELADASATSEAIHYWIQQLRENQAKERLLRLSDHIAGMVREQQPIPDILARITNTTSDLSHFGPQEKVASRIRRWIESGVDGQFGVTECDKETGIVTNSDKNNRRTILTRLVKEGLIERVHGKTGIYRRIDQNCETIDFKSASIKNIDFRLPFGMERFLHIMPKNILVFAGSPNAGKTALLLNIIYLNQKRHRIFYFSSEMGEMELRSRLRLFRDIAIDDWTFKALERSDNFADVIRPDAVNIIDFLEITDNFYAVGQRLFEIYQRLKNGIAIIALQKDKKAEYGRGQSFSLEKPRLYCTVDQAYPGALLKIKKCKNWRDPELNPNNMQIRFKIVQGCNLYASGGWERDI